MHQSAPHGCAMQYCMLLLLLLCRHVQLWLYDAVLYVAGALQGMYKASKKRFDEDPEFKERARKAVTLLQGGDADFIKAWERICEASRKVCRLPKPLSSVLACCTQHGTRLLHYASADYVSGPAKPQDCSFCCQEQTTRCTAAANHRRSFWHVVMHAVWRTKDCR